MNLLLSRILTYLNGSLVDDCYYRLRGVHLVVANGTREMLTSQTDGVLITK